MPVVPTTTTTPTVLLAKAFIAIRIATAIATAIVRTGVVAVN